MQGIEGQRALVTGAGKGIGREIALPLAHGEYVWLCSNPRLSRASS